MSSRKYSKNIDEFTNSSTQEVLEIIQNDVSFVSKWNALTGVTDNKTADMIMLAFYVGQQQGYNEVVEKVQYALD